jgi:hypothetical protein
MTDADLTLAAALSAIERSKLGEKQRKALALVIEGRSYREAAHAAGLGSTTTLKAHARRFGLAEAHKRARAVVVAEEAEAKTAATIAVVGKVAKLGAEEMLRRLQAEPGEIQTRDLVTVTGVAIDKLAKWEKWGETQPDPGAGVRILDRMEAAIASGVSLALTITRRPELEPRVIDVTPASPAGGGTMGDGR